MLVRYFRRPSGIEELRNNTGGSLLEGFAKELSRGSYQWVAARKHIGTAEHFFHWMAHRKLTITSVEERCAQQFLDHLKRCRCRGHHPPLKPHRQEYSVDLWFAYLGRAGIVTTPRPAEPATETPLLATFCDWMRQQRGVSDTTLSIYRFAHISQLSSTNNGCQSNARPARTPVIRMRTLSGSSSHTPALI